MRALLLAWVMVLGPGVAGCKKAPEAAAEPEPYAYASSEVLVGLPDAPDGYAWQSCPDPLVSAFLVPDGWHTRSEERDGTIAMFITPEPFVDHFTTGLSVNVVRGVPAKAGVKPSEYALAFLSGMEARAAHAGPITRYDAAGGIVVLDRYVKLEPPDGSPTQQVLYRLYANDRTGTLFMLFFEAPASDWNHAEHPAREIIDVVAISPGD